MIHQARSLLVATLLGAALAACVGEIGGGDDGPNGGASSNASNAPAAPATAQGVAVPLARLTRTQYENTVRDLFAPLALPPDLELPPADVAVANAYETNTATQTPSAGLIDGYQSAAVRIAAVVMTDSALLRIYAPTPPTTRADEDAAARAFIDGFAKKAYRRPLAPDDVAQLTALYDAARAQGSDLDGAIRMLVQAVLQSATFLYRIEVGAPVAGKPGVAALTSYEMASRLSYLLWNSAPDDALFAAAAANELSTVEGIERHARRLLADSRAHASILKFFAQWLRLDQIGDLRKDAAAFPGFDTTTAAAMRDAAKKRVEGVFFGAGTLEALFTDNHAWVDDQLAGYYGVPPPGASLVPVALDPAQRSGLLTDIGVLSLLAHEGADSPVLRGVYVLDRLACHPPAPPPPNVAPPPAVDQAHPKTTRERFEQLHEQGGCAGCHKMIDGIGFAFGHYDAVGKWRATDQGLPIDDSGHFEPVGDLQGTFVGASELGRQLVKSRTVQTCVASNWMRYALGVDAHGFDDAQLTLTTDAFVASGLDLRELVIALVKSDAFRTRYVEP